MNLGNVFEEKISEMCCSFRQKEKKCYGKLLLLKNEPHSNIANILYFSGYCAEFVHEYRAYPTGSNLDGMEWNLDGVLFIVFKHAGLYNAACGKGVFVRHPGILHSSAKCI